MQLSEGVEWAAHLCALLAALPPGRALNVATLAEYHELPKAYLAKHMQALARAGVVRSTRGANGGYRLARAASEISLWDIRVAIEGIGPDFHCRDIRKRGPCAVTGDKGRVCEIARAFWDAERSYRERLAATTLSTIVTEVSARASAEDSARFFRWVGKLG